MKRRQSECPATGQRDYGAVQKHPHDTTAMQDGGTAGG